MDEVKAAYGREYKNQKEIKADWNANNDFQLFSTGQYINKADAIRYGLSGVIVRYGKNYEKVCGIYL